MAPPHVADFAGAGGPVEQVISGHEREFFTRFTGTDSVVRAGSLDAAVRAYSPPGRLSAALAQYRTLPRDAADNRRAVHPTLDMPALALEGGAPGISLASLRRVGSDVRSIVVPEAGHYVQEDQPDAYAAALSMFLR